MNKPYSEEAADNLTIAESLISSLITKIMSEDITYRFWEEPDKKVYVFELEKNGKRIQTRVCEKQIIHQPMFPYYALETARKELHEQIRTNQQATA